jgi:hypothetical protein
MILPVYLLREACIPGIIFNSILFYTQKCPSLEAINDMVPLFIRDLSFTTCFPHFTAALESRQNRGQYPHFTDEDTGSAMFKVSLAQLGSGGRGS